MIRVNCVVMLIVLILCEIITSRWVFYKELEQDIQNSPFIVKINNHSRKFTSENYDNFKLLDRYDFIIVGAGPAGCVLANRLSEDPYVSVLLLEAGRPDLEIFTDVLLTSATLQESSFNWGYVTTEQKKACLSMQGDGCRFPHGKGLGGSTLINYQIYTRGNRRDFDRWHEAGNEGWSYEDVLPYFLKSEGAHLKHFKEIEYHGENGPVSVEDPPYKTKIAHAHVKSSQEFGLPYVDYNGREQIGVSYLQSTAKHGWRRTAEEAYLQPIKDRQNLHISTESKATRLILNKKTPHHIVDGVTFVRNKQEFNVYAAKEVILSAGAFESPKLLMLSGIGPRKQLESLGIKVVKDLPVGETLYDHPIVYAPIYTVGKVDDGLINIEDVVTPKNIEKWYKGKGPLTSVGVETLTFIKANPPQDPDPGFPDAELLQLATTPAFDAPRNATTATGLKPEVFDAVFRPLQYKRAFLFIIMLLHPRSKGYLKLNGTNPFNQPIINPNFYTEETDIITQISAIRTAQKITLRKAYQHLKLRQYVSRLPGCENYIFDTDAYWKCHITHLSTTLHHQVATCKMGPKSDPTSVVDPELKVHGYKNLRVADISIIPFAPSGHTSAFSYMIGEKASDMIKGKWSRIFKRFLRSARSVSFFGNFRTKNQSRPIRQSAKIKQNTKIPDGIDVKIPTELKHLNLTVERLSIEDILKIVKASGDDDTKTKDGKQSKQETTTQSVRSKLMTKVRPTMKPIKLLVANSGGPQNRKDKE